MAEGIGNSDILSQLTGNGETSNAKSEVDILKSIDTSLRNIAKNVNGVSASNANNKISSSGSNADVFSNRWNYKNVSTQFKNGFSKTLMDSVIDADFKTQITEVFSDFAKDLGVSVKDIPAGVGKALGEKLIGQVKNTDLGKQFYSGIENLKNKSIESLKNTYSEWKSKYFSKSRSSSAVKDLKGKASEVIKPNVASEAGTSEIVNTAMSAVTTGSVDAGAALAGLSDIAVTLGPYALLLVGGLIALDNAMDAVTPAIQGTKKAFEAAEKAANRYNASQKENVKLAQKRLEDDIKTMVEAPFTILKNAAQELYNSWDNNLRTINATQGYNKEDLQNLIGNFAERLRNEGLTKYVSASDITNNLAKVLESGLSGQVAEEFAYIATKLNAAVPTQDFFTYGSTYASLAANAIRQGKSQADAIAYANSQLESFASNVLYANREIAGGFTTGLKDAEDLFEKSVKIAQAGKTDNVSGISGVLTAISANIGSIAPEFTSAIIDAVYNAAVGGNNSEIVALRSLAGINASNTEFLKELSNNPQSVFTNLFSKLGEYQHMSDGAYMEVAEGLSSIFGISAQAFSQVDFNYLAQAISAMNTSNVSLSDNMELLLSGETTTNAEQMKMQQINQYMLDEGLSYVLDNEAARSIQEHMWDEQIARDLMESTYGVEIQGAALEFLQGIKETISNILGFMNPTHWLSKIRNLSLSVAESNAQKADVSQLLELGKIGTGNIDAKYQLTTRNKDLNITDNILNLMGGHSIYAGISSVRSKFDALDNLTANYIGYKLGGLTAESLLAGSLLGKAENFFNSSKTSGYGWGLLGKSAASALNAKVIGVPVSGISSLTNSYSATETAKTKSVNNIQSMLDTMEQFANNGKSYDDWANTAKKYGISNLSTALENAGLSESQARSQFDTYTTKIAAEEEQKRKEKEEQFWTDNIEQITASNSWLESIFNQQKEFFDRMVDYFITHTVYSEAYNHASVTKIQNQEKKQSTDAVYALADALTQNNVDLLDPTVQTNVLLSQILQVASAIMQQNNNMDTNISIPDQIAGMALGII